MVSAVSSLKITECLDKGKVSLFSPSIFLILLEKYTKLTLKTESFIKAPDAFAVQTVEERNLLVDLGGFVENSPEGE